MRIHEFEHVVRAAGGVLDTHDIIVVGSQAILSQLPRDFVDQTLQVSRELDIIPMNDPDLADLISGSIGEGSPFDGIFGYYGDGVALETVVAPRSWTERLVVYESENTNGVRAHCIEKHDLVLAKYVANREKDRDFIAAMADRGLCDEQVLLHRVADLPVGPEEIDGIRARIRRDFGGSKPDPNSDVGI